MGISRYFLFRIGIVIIIHSLFIVNLQADNPKNYNNKSRNFKISANIVKGCEFNQVSTTNLNSINFGYITSLQKPIDTIYNYDLGSLRLKCTPGVSVNLALDSGKNLIGNISQGRLLKKTFGNQILRYQLFQDAAHSIIWGNDINGGKSKSVITLGMINNQYYIYARLFNSNLLPESGQYEDIVTVTISY
ncbi:MAG: spore coat U domain-containing protein [Candidatus Dasytiphilus stammeri]